jgi:YD repeat-containing protein
LTDAFPEQSTIGGWPLLLRNPYRETYGYNPIGNLTSKAGTSYSYGPRALGSGGGGPHAAITVGGQNLTYDANGNLLSGPNLGGSGTRSFTWNADNQPTSITSGGVTEQYVYDADGERISRTRGGVTTYYLGGLAEVDGSNGTVRHLYPFNGQVVAQREIIVGKTNTLIYLHGDHLWTCSDEAWQIWDLISPG